jgi:hypothetical protein
MDWPGGCGQLSWTDMPVGLCVSGVNSLSPMLPSAKGTSRLLLLHDKDQP